jgi:hypothetical protein
MINWGKNKDFACKENVQGNEDDFRGRFLLGKIFLLICRNEIVLYQCQGYNKRYESISESS